MRSLTVAVGRYTGSPEGAAEVDGFAVEDGADEQALNKDSKTQNRTNDRDVLI
jgi:hypothetical protein